MNPTVDPFAEFRLNNIRKNQNSQGMATSEEMENPVQIQDRQDPFQEFRIKPEEKPSFLHELGRHSARISSRIAETIGGIPGDISSLLQSGALYGLEKFSGKKIPQEAIEEAKSHRLPTSHELKEFSQKKTKGFTTPQGELEKFGDELAQTATSLLGPMKFRKSLGIALGSESVKKAVEIARLPESGQEAAKAGTMFLLTIMNPGGAMKYSSSQYEKSRALAKGASIKSEKFSENLTKLRDSLNEGVSTPSKDSVLKPTQELLKKAEGGKIPVNELTSAKRDVNTLMGDPAILHRDKKLLKKLASDIDNAIKPYEKINPEFAKVYRPANEIHGAIMEGNKASNFIKKNLGIKSFLATIVAEAGSGHPEYIFPTVAATTVGLGAARTADFFSRLTKSPELRKYYGRALVAAAKEDLGALRSYSDKIDRYLEKNQ